jgi:RHS repeat-associated protein
VATKEEVFSHDAVGNRLADANISGYQYDVANRLLENSSFTYTYDANGSQTSKKDKVTNRTTTFIYNSENQLVQANLPDGTQASYKYDAFGRRIEKIVGTAITRYIYDGMDLLAMLDESNSPITIFTHGPGINAPLVMHKADGTDFFYHADALGSITSLSDSASSVVERVEYEAYGKPSFIHVGGQPPTISTISSVGSPFAFTAIVFDTETGMSKPIWRMLDHDIGRFPQEDPIWLTGDDANMYAYVDSVGKGSSNAYQYAFNNPVRYVDPNGTNPVLLGAPAWALIGIDAITLYMFWGAYNNSTWQNGVLTIPPASDWNKSSFWFTPALPIPVGLQWDTNQPFSLKMLTPKIIPPAHTQMCPTPNKML